MSAQSNALNVVAAAVPDAPIMSEEAPGQSGFQVHRVGIAGVLKDPRFTTDAAGNFSRGIVWVHGEAQQFSDLAAFAATLLLVGAL